ncbi:MAG: amidohydrolase [Eubacteriales bacterium]|nr:amidohydrolase [Eubacteriales bacterium]
MLTKLTRYRRDLHRIPETGFDLFETTAYVKDLLAPLGCRVFSPIEGAVCAYFDRGQAQTVAFRADMDALPVEEKTGAPYASVHPGRMHACGHDGHTSMLLGLAEIVAAQKTLPNNVLLIFQPAEETTGGARDICETGVLEQYRVKAIFAIHIFPDIPAGALRASPGPMMAKTGIVDVEIFGKSAHMSRMEEGADALYAGALWLCRAYDMIGTALPEREKRLLRFGVMQSGTVQNALSAHTVLSGTMRSFSEETHAFLFSQLERIAAAVEEETGCKIRLSMSEGYPPVRNDEMLFASVMEHLGADAPKPIDAPSLAGEDFSFYQKRVPGVFFLLGTGRATPLHADTFDFDESILTEGVRLFERLLTI